MSDSNISQAESRSRLRRWGVAQYTRKTWLTLGAVALAITAVVVGVALIVTGLGQPNPVKDMRGNPVQLSGAPLTSDQMRRMNVKPTDERFIVASVGLNVPLDTLNEVDGLITPPGFTSAYRIRNFGESLDTASHGTVFVVMHSIRGGGTGPGNYLIDVTTGQSAVRVGTAVQVGTRTYLISGWKSEPKKQVPSDVALWANTPGRLVIITCLQLSSGGESVNNMIFTAQLKS